MKQKMILRLCFAAVSLSLASPIFASDWLSDSQAAAIWQSIGDQAARLKALGKPICIKGEVVSLSRSNHMPIIDRNQQIGYDAYQDYNGVANLAVDNVNGVEFYDAGDYRLNLVPGSCYKVTKIDNFGDRNAISGEEWREIRVHFQAQDGQKTYSLTAILRKNK